MRKEYLAQMFPVNFAKCLKTPFSKNTSGGFSWVNISFNFSFTKSLIFSSFISFGFYEYYKQSALYNHLQNKFEKPSQNRNK